MIEQRMTIRLGLLFLLLGTTTAWSKRTHKAGAHNSPVAASESKIEARYAEEPKASQSAYPLDGGYPFPKGPGHSEEYVDSEDHKSIKEQDEAQGNNESDDTEKSDEYDEHSEKAGHKDFKAGGYSFDKHLKDHKADKKEVENVKQHDIGEKFGGERTKEHKLGKHKEKSKGHKLHGFKNVYHKEEYGDHKTFHDEFLDTDHQHNYDDHHEHQEVEGGKFSKGFKQEGKNNKHDKGDEKHEWGKEDFDVHSEGKRDKGGNKSKHRHSTKKHQGHYDANAHRQKNAVHKIKNGSPPAHIPHIHHGGHHGPHQAQIEPYVPHYNSQHEQTNIPSSNYDSHTDTQSHQAPYEGDSHGGNENHGNHPQSHVDHHSTHGNHQHPHVGHYDNGHNDEAQDNYHERTAQNHQHRGPGKELLEDKSDDKVVPNIKQEQVIHNGPTEQRHDAVVHTHEPVSYKTQPAVHAHEPTVQKHESHSYKHRPHTHNHQSHTHKHSFSPNHETQHYRKPVFQENSQFRFSQPFRNEKFSEPSNDKFSNHNHRIRYGFQPRNYQQNNHNHRFQYNSNHHSHQHQPLPRFQGFNRHHQSHGSHHQSHGNHHQSHQHQPHHHHHNSNKNHTHLRYTPSNNQQAYRSNVHAPKYEQTPINPNKNEEQHVISQKHYE